MKQWSVQEDQNGGSVCAKVGIPRRLLKFCENLGYVLIDKKKRKWYIADV